MPLTTTTIGAYPKPDYIEVPDWFNITSGPDTAEPTMGWAKAVEAMGDEAEAIFARGVKEVIEDQVGAGIDIPTDGEVRRENYIHYHCRHLAGFDFENLTEKEVRGVYSAKLPTIRGPLRAGENFLPHDWRVAQSYTDTSVKITIPGPMTIADTVVDAHYNDAARLGRDLATALNAEVRALAEAGCRHIQIDEPVFARQPENALAYGFENLDRCFHDTPPEVVRTVHMCCGYPDRLDHPDYPKAPKESGRAPPQRPRPAGGVQDHQRHPWRGRHRQEPGGAGRGDPRSPDRGLATYRCGSPDRGARLRPRPARARSIAQEAAQPRRCRP
jgi:5-methyltetrahydropteroyltriglutamate--homocysteine methyltransferase